MIAYASIEEAAKGQNAKYVAALIITVASVPAREYFFSLTGANARIMKRDKGRGEEYNKVLGAYGRNVLNEESNLLLGCTEDNKLALLKTFFGPLNESCPTPSKAPAAARGKFVWTVL